MSDWLTLSQPPIVEGLIDFRVERDPSLTVDMLKIACDELAEDFPSRQERHRWSGEITLSAAAGASLASSVPEADGIVLRSTDDKWVVQFRLDGFTVSRLEPYGSWSALIAKSTELWAKYTAIAKPSRILRVATRFINRIGLPLGESFDSTFITVFAIAPALPQSVAGYLLRMVIPFEPEQALAILTQSLDANSTECVFDLDVFAEPPEGFSPSDAWQKLEILRNIKNRLFFESLTPTALEKFR